MRALFIIHCQDPIYGASRSVSALIRNLDADIDLIFPVAIRKSKKLDKDYIQQYYGSRIKNVYVLPQPSRYTALNAKFPLSTHIKSSIKEFLMIFYKRRYERIYQEGHYDFIHLNSVILYPLLDQNYPMFLHVREIVRKKRGWIDRNFYHYMNKAHGIFFIDHATRDACPDLNIPQTILVNPFDQLRVKDVDYESALKDYKIQKDQTIYSIIGNILPGKGVLFVVSAFQKAKLNNAVLLIVGEDKARGQYSEMVKTIAAGDPSIHVVGEVEDMDPIYRLTDYVVRGDELVGLGRTVFEGLFSGCNVIIPSDMPENDDFPDIPHDLRDKIFPYLLCDEESLIRVFQKTQHQKAGNRKYYSNISSYLTSFKDFINNRKANDL